MIMVNFSVSCMRYVDIIGSSELSISCMRYVEIIGSGIFNLVYYVDITGSAVSLVM